MNNLAYSYHALGRHAEALKLREETLALRKAKLGPDHPDTLTSMNNLATSYYALGRHAEALKLHEETLALRKAKLGPTTPTRWKAGWAWRAAWCSSVAAPRPPRTAGGRPRHGRSWSASMPIAGTSTTPPVSGPSPPPRCARPTSRPREPNRRRPRPTGPWPGSSGPSPPGYHDAAAMAEDHELDALRHRADFKELLGAAEHGPAEVTKSVPGRASGR